MRRRNARRLEVGLLVSAARQGVEGAELSKMYQQYLAADQPAYRGRVDMEEDMEQFGAIAGDFMARARAGGLHVVNEDDDEYLRLLGVEPPKERRPSRRD